MITRIRAAAALTASALALTACGSDAGEDGAARSGPFVVGTIPNVSSASANLADSEGIYAEHDLEVELRQATGFAPNLASVVNGETQVGFASVVPLLVARSKGAPIKIIAGTDRAPDSFDAASDPASISVAKESEIRDAKDLEGATVAVTALGSIQDLGTRIMVAKAGGDPSKVKFLALPSNEMIDALEADRVDAVALSEPFTTVGKQGGLRSLFSYSTEAVPGQPVGAYFTSERTLAQDAKGVTAFVDSIDQVTKEMAKDPDLVRDALPDFTQIKPAVAAEVNLYEYDSTITPEQVDELSGLLVDNGYMKEPVAADSVLATP